MDFKEELCSRLQQAPYVCNGCSDKLKCTLHKRFYTHAVAQEAYKTLLTEARSGANISELELEATNIFICPLIKNGQSPHHVMTIFPDKFNFCEKTLYRYIDEGLVGAKNHHLPRRTRLKPRKGKSIEHKVDRKCRIGRTFDDYRHYMDNHPDISVVQMDSVIGCKGGKVLLTFCFGSTLLLLAFLRDHNTSQSVIDIFDYLTDLLTLDTFRCLFPVILTDNGPEFSNPHALEFTKDGKRRTNIFYCDPNRSDQKGIVEVEHEMIRRILPSGSSFDSLSQKDINLVLSHVNSYRRKKLNDKSPFDSFSFFFGRDILSRLDISQISSADIILRPTLIKS